MTDSLEPDASTATTVNSSVSFTGLFWITLGIFIVGLLWLIMVCLLKRQRRSKMNNKKPIASNVVVRRKRTSKKGDVKVAVTKKRYKTRASPKSGHDTEGEHSPSSLQADKSSSPGSHLISTQLTAYLTGSTTSNTSAEHASRASGCLTNSNSDRASSSSTASSSSESNRSHLPRSITKEVDSAKTAPRSCLVASKSSGLASSFSTTVNATFEIENGGKTSTIAKHLLAPKLDLLKDKVLPAKKGKTPNSIAAELNCNARPSSSPALGDHSSSTSDPSIFSVESSERDQVKGKAANS